MSHHRKVPDVQTLSIRKWIGSLLVFLLLILLFWKIALKLVGDWYQLPEQSHGFLIPLFAGFLVWEKRNTLRRVVPVSSWFGLLLLVPALFLLIVGVCGADLFLSRFSFVLLLAGLVWTLLGSTLLRQLKFVLLILLLAIPLPTLVANQITFPLQLLASQVASWLLAVAGVPVLRNGNVLQLASLQLEVAEACSGIRSLFSLLTCAVIFAYFLETSTWRRVVLVFSSVPIAIGANAVRIFGTGLCVQYWDADKAVGFFHEFSGWLMFLVSLACLYTVLLVLRRISVKAPVPA